MLRRFRQLGPSSLLSTVLLTAFALIVAACSAQADASGDCLAPKNGALVAVPCEAPPGATLEPTPTPSSVSVPAPDDPGLQAFLGAACQVCHTIDGIPQANGQIGPNLTNVEAKGADYIRESIMAPGAVVVEDCPLGACAVGVMPLNFSTALTPEQIDAIVEFLAAP